MDVKEDRNGREARSFENDFKSSRQEPNKSVFKVLLEQER